MINLLFVSLALASPAKARDVQFNCSNQDSHTLIFRADERLLTTTTTSPELADIVFTFDGHTHIWPGTQYLSLPLATNEIATLFRNQTLDELFIQHDANSNSAFANLTLNRTDFELECQKSYPNGPGEFSNKKM
jgi:hypothetical protein